MKTREYIGKLTTGKWTRMTVLAIAAFIVPYIFAYSPAMLFVNVTSVWAVIQIVLSALLGIFGVAAGLEGFMLRKMNWLFRLICIGVVAA